MNKALFINLDNCLITTKSGEQIPVDNNDWELNSRIIPKISYYAKEGYFICVVANQASIERGLVTEEDFTAKMDAVKQELEEAIDDTVSYIFCPFLKHYSRKPNPGMAYKFAMELELNLRECVMVGCTKNDMQFTYNSGIGKYIEVNNF